MLPVVWVYHEPLGDIDQLGLTLAIFSQSKNWKSIATDCNNKCLEAIDKLGVPILLIGGPRDVIDCNFKNITVGNSSWQKWLANASGMTVENDVIKVTPPDGGNYDLSHCWGSELIHRFLHENPKISPDPELLNSIWDMYYFWEELQRRDWFYDVHPNKKGNVEFAKFLQSTIDKFLKENSNG